MLIVPSALHGYSIEAKDGSIGTIKDFLFDDRSWQCRWLVIDTGTWLSSRKVLIHPSALGPFDHEYRSVVVNLTQAQVKDSPAIEMHAPVSQQVELGLYDYYGWDPFWGNGLYGATTVSQFTGPQRFFGGPTLTPPPDISLDPTERDPNLRSMAEVTGYHVAADDGAIGHVENLLVDDKGLGVRYLIIDTSNWWLGRHVLMSPFAIREVEDDQRKIFLDVSRQAVKDSPPWDPLAMIKQDEQEHLHRHYGWMGYGW